MLSEEAVIEARLRALHLELEAKRAELNTSSDRESARHLDLAQVRLRMQELRGMDA